MNRFLLIFAALLANTTTEAEVADGKALYDLAPADAAYIRVVNRMAMPQQVQIGNHNVSVASQCGVSEVLWVDADTTLTDGKPARAGYLHTVYVGERLVESTVIERDEFVAKLALKNASTNAVSLVTSAANRPVFVDVPPASSMERTLNPISVELSIQAEGESPAAVPVRLQRGKTVEIIVCDDQLRHNVSIY